MMFMCWPPGPKLFSEVGSGSKLLQAMGGAGILDESQRKSVFASALGSRFIRGIGTLPLRGSTETHEVSPGVI